MLCVADRTVERRIKEALRIHVQGDGVMNRDLGLELSKLWLSLFVKICACETSEKSCKGVTLTTIHGDCCFHIRVKL